MPDHSHHSHDHHAGKPSGSSKGIHKDWRLWTAVILMLVGMAVYILTQDESLPPGGQPAQPVPAAS